MVALYADGPKRRFKSAALTFDVEVSLPDSLSEYANFLAAQPQDSLLGTAMLSGKVLRIDFGRRHALVRLLCPASGKRRVD